MLQCYCDNENDKSKLTYGIIKKVLYGSQIQFTNIDGKLPEPDTEEDDDNDDNQGGEDITPVVKYLYIGSLNMLEQHIDSMSQITAEHITTNLVKYEDGVYKEPVVTDRYDVIVVAVLQDRTAYIDNGLGSKTEFNTAYNDIDGNSFCSNGEITCEIDGNTYHIYGVLTSVAGTNYIYVE